MKEVIELGKEYVSVSVWDVPTRILHWLNALTIISLAIFALTMWKIAAMNIPDDDIKVMLIDTVKLLHIYAGYSLTVTFTLRIVWGIFGNRYARFSDMISFKKEHWRAVGANIKWYLNGFRGHPPVSIGHNPLASLFYVPLFIVLGIQVVSGIILAGIVYDVFPGTLLTARFGMEQVDALEMKADTIHIYGFYFIIFFFCAHMAGLVVHEIGERCGLFSSMIHGRKYFQKEDLNP